MHRIVIADPLEQSGLEILRAAGADVRVLAADDRPRLPELVADADALVVRSATKVTRELLAGAARLRVVGRAGIGVDNVDVPAATQRGVLVVNAPTANVISATEHTFAMMLALARRVPAADASMKRGEWDRKSFLGSELHGKTLGVIGFGRIGQQVAVRARAFEMTVVAYDPVLDPATASRLQVEAVEVDALLARADIVTFHTPLTATTRGMLDARRLALMKPGARVINCGRGGTIDEAALLAALDSGRLGGAALDVYAEEPTAQLELVRHARVVATPHIGAQTGEAQERIAVETARMVLAALAGSLAIAAVNLPFASTGQREEPWLRLGDRLGRLAAGLEGGRPVRIEIERRGVDDEFEAPISVAVLRGVLAVHLGDEVNFVNAGHLAEARGLTVSRATSGVSDEESPEVVVRLITESGQIELVGALVGGRMPRVLGIAGYRLEFWPEGELLVVESRDVPGVVGRLGTLLGDAGVNIGDIHLARREASGETLAVLRIDERPSTELLERLRATPEVARVDALRLG